MSDDLLNPDEIEALLAAGGKDAPKPDNAASTETETTSQHEASQSDDAEDSQQTADSLLAEAEAKLATALQPNLGDSSNQPQPQPFSFESFEESGAAGDGKVGWDTIQEVELDLTIELGRTELLIEEVLQLQEGAVVPLDKLAGDPVDILVNGRLIARGEVLVLNDNFCVRVAEILAPEY